MSSGITCEWSGCTRKRWTPYSLRYCPWHFAWNALEIDRERKKLGLPPIARSWVRERFCGVLNGCTPHLGDVAWDTNHPREELELIATEVLGMALDEGNEVQWRVGKAVLAEQFPHNYRDMKSRTEVIRRSVRSINETGSA